MLCATIYVAIDYGIAINIIVLYSSIPGEYESELSGWYKGFRQMQMYIKTLILVINILKQYGAMANIYTMQVEHTDIK